MTQSLSPQQGARPRFTAGMRPWAPPPTSSALSAIEAAPSAPFVFHDPAGRRWSRVKRVALVVAVAVVVVGGAVLVAVTQIAPGRAPAFTGAPAQQVPDWQVRNSGGSAAQIPGGPTAAPSAGRLAGSNGSSAAPASTSAPSARPSPSPTVKPRRPRPTPTPH